MFDLNEAPDIAAQANGAVEPPASICFGDVTAEVVSCSVADERKDGKRTERVEEFEAELPPSNCKDSQPTKHSSPTIDLLPGTHFSMHENTAEDNVRELMSVSSHLQEARRRDVELLLPSPTPLTEEETTIITDLMLSPSVRRNISTSLKGNLLQLSLGKEAAKASCEKNEIERLESASACCLNERSAKKSPVLEDQTQTQNALSDRDADTSVTHLLLQDKQVSASTSLGLGNGISNDIVNKCKSLALFRKSFELASLSTSNATGNGFLCWQGKLHTDSPFPIPIVACQLGDFGNSDILLKKLPRTLRLAKLMKLEEFGKVLKQGAVHAVSRFGPSLDASSEEVELFYSLVKTLLGEPEPRQNPFILDLELGQQVKAATLPLAALMSWDDDLDHSLGAELYLVSFHSLRSLEVLCTDSLFGIDVPDEVKQNYLFGIFVFAPVCSSGATTDFLKMTKPLDLEGPVMVSPNIVRYLERCSDASTVDVNKAKGCKVDEQGHAEIIVKTKKGDNIRGTCEDLAALKQTHLSEMTGRNHPNDLWSKQDLVVAIGQFKDESEGSKGKQTADADNIQWTLEERFSVTYASNSSNLEFPLENHDKKRGREDDIKTFVPHKCFRESNNDILQDFDQDNTEETFIPLTMGSVGLPRGSAGSNWDDILPSSSPANAPQSDEISCEFQLDGLDKETRTWISSSQCVLYLQEEYGVVMVVRPELLFVPDSATKIDTQTGPLHIRISMLVSEMCDSAEAKWFVDQAAYVIRATASRGVFVKCLWYEGPVQLQPGYGLLSVAAVVKKIKGDDGKNLERLQNVTGVVIGVVLRKGVIETKPQSRYIGLRLKSIRRKGLLEASTQAEALLACVADYFAKEVTTNTRGQRGLNEELPNKNTIISKFEYSPASPQKADRGIELPNSVLQGFMKESNAMMMTVKEDPDKYSMQMDRNKGATRSLYVSNLPDNITAAKICSIVENTLRDKLGISGGLDNRPDLVVDARYIADKHCARVELASDELLYTCVKLYREDKSIFRGLSVELCLSPLKGDRPSSFSSLGGRNIVTDVTRRTSMCRSKVEDTGQNHHELEDHIWRQNELEEHGRRYNEFEEHVRRHLELDDHARVCGEVLGNDNQGSDLDHDTWFGSEKDVRADLVDKPPRPLFLTELMRNASTQSIKELFEEIIMTYVGVSLASSSGRQLVLDVRHVPSRGCAFVDLATPELVEFMLDLHSRRPEVFKNMKMELGRRPVPYAVELEKRPGRDSSHGRSSTHKHGYGVSSLESRKIGQKSRGSQKELDYADELDRGRSKKQVVRSDPEKTVYADRLPEGASEGVIRRIFERVLLRHMTRDMDDFDVMITEVRYIPTKYCAFIVFATEELTRLALQLYNENEDIFEKMRLKPHFHSRLEDLFKDIDMQEPENSPQFKNRDSDIDSNDCGKLHQTDLYHRMSAHRAVSATVFIEVDRSRSVYVDKIPEGISDFSLKEMLEKVYQHKKAASSTYMVTQIAYFRDKFDSNKLCAFVELKNERAAEDLVDFYLSHQDAFRGMRIRPGLKFNN